MRLGGARGGVAAAIAFCALASLGLGAQALGAGGGADQALLRVKLAPPDAEVFAQGRELALSPPREGWRELAVPSGLTELEILAEGYVAASFPLITGAPAPDAAIKLERAGSSLRFIGSAPTGARPKSVYYVGDRILAIPLLSGSGVDLVDADTLIPLGRLVPPERYAKQEGFVECLHLSAARELWVSQMYSSRIHVFDTESLEWKLSFPSGGDFPKVMALSPDGVLVFVSNWVSEDVSVIEVTSHRVLARVGVDGTPRGLAVSPDGEYLYIACFVGGSVLRLRVDDLRLETLYPEDGGAKRALALDAKRGRLYATDMDRGSLFALDAATGELLAEIPLGPNPNGLALAPDGRHVFACTRGPNGSRGYELPGPLAGELIVVDAEWLAVVDRQWGGNQPTGLAVSPDGAMVVFTDFLDRRVEAYRVDPDFGRIR